MFSSLLNSLAGRDNREPGDYIGEDGLLVCGKCGTPKQCLVRLPLPGSDEMRKCPCVCRCQNEKNEREAAERRRMEFRQNHNGLTDPAYARMTFAADDNQHPTVSAACKKYVAEWQQMRANNVGLLFFGGVGTGKTFFACCIANVLIDQCISVLVTSFPRVLNKIQSSKWGGNKNELLDNIQRYPLVIIDDLGVERMTDFAMEQMFNIVDTRYRSGKPLIITTNLAPSDLKKPENLFQSRIFDRILQNCLPVKVTGDSRRSAIAVEKRDTYQSFLGIGNG